MQAGRAVYASLCSVRGGWVYIVLIVALLAEEVLDARTSMNMERNVRKSAENSPQGTGLSRNARDTGVGIDIITSIRVAKSGQQYRKTSTRKTKARHRRDAGVQRARNVGSQSQHTMQHDASWVGKWGSRKSEVMGGVSFPSSLRTNSKGFRAQAPNQCIGTCV